jgi:hypothetical protein
MQSYPSIRERRPNDAIKYPICTKWIESKKQELVALSNLEKRRIRLQKLAIVREGIINLKVLGFVEQTEKALAQVYQERNQPEMDFGTIITMQQTQNLSLTRLDSVLTKLPIPQLRQCLKHFQAQRLAKKGQLMDQPRISISKMSTATKQISSQ